MFNSGEVPIFSRLRDPAGFLRTSHRRRPPTNLTYMTVHNNSEERDAAWAKFMSHPDWKKLSSMEKYRDTVSKVIKIDLKPRPYSQL